MIRSLRQRHRVMVLTLSVLLPAGFVLGIATRQSVPTVASLPGSLAGDAHPFKSALWAREDLWSKHAIRTSLLTDDSRARFAVELAPKEALVLPDVLVYWVPGENAIKDTLPDSAFLLGTLSAKPPRPLLLPPDARRRQGALVLYSLADQEIVNTSRLFAAK